MVLIQNSVKGSAFPKIFGASKMKLYFAGPLFSEADRDWIRSTIRQLHSIAAQHGKELEIIFPYDLIPQPKSISSVPQPNTKPSPPVNLISMMPTW